LRQSKLGGHSPSLFYHDAVRLEYRVDVAGGAPGVVRQCHRCAAYHAYVGNETSSGQPVTETPKRVLERLPVMDWNFHNPHRNAADAGTPWHSRVAGR
jgi:hypothetical protein